MLIPSSEGTLRLRVMFEWASGRVKGEKGLAAARRGFDS